MTRVAIKGLVGRRARTVLTALAIVLGVAMISGALTLADTLRHAADSLTTASYRGTDAVIDAHTTFTVTGGGSATQPTIPAGLLSQVRAVPGVAVAVGDLTNSETRIIDGHGQALGRGPYFGVGFDALTPGSAKLTPFRLKAGHYATTANQVVIDAGTAAKHDVRLGSSVRVAARGPVQTFTVSGIATFGSVDSIGGATFAVFDPATAQRLFGEPGRYDGILVAARPGVSATALRSALATAIPRSARVQTAATQDRFDLKSLKQFISIVEIVLLAFGGIAIFVGSFTIFNTLSITVAQRSRELAMLRTIGGSRRQVLGSVMLEALVLGTAGSAVGLGVGVLLAQGLSSLLSSLGLALPQAGTVFAAHTAIVAPLVGLTATALAGLGPALHTTRISPVLALCEGSFGESHTGSRRAVRIGTVLAMLALALVLAGMFAGGVATGTRFVLIVPGCLLLFIAVALFSGRIAAPLASLLGRPARRFGGAAGELARRNAMRHPARTAATAAALMVGIALVVSVSTIGAGLKQSTTGTLEHRLRASYVVAADDGYSPIDPGIERTLAHQAGVTSTSSIAQDQVRIHGHTITINGIEPQTIAGAYRYTWAAGSQTTLTSLGGDGAIVDRSFADTHRLSVGSQITASTAAGAKVQLVVRGIDVPPRWGALGLGPVTVSSRVFDSMLPLARDRLTFITANSPQASLQARLSAYPGVKVMTSQAFARQQMSWVDQMLAIIYVLLALAVLVSLFGIVNALALAVIERTRELGMLRAVGMTRRQVRRMVRHESVITALFGATLGIAVGLFLAALVTVALSGEGLQFAIPAGSLVAFVVIAVLAGLGAAIGPARRAARLDPLSALAYE